jgi:hypothetical protein
LGEVSGSIAVTPTNCTVDAVITPWGKTSVGAEVVDPTGAAQTVTVNARRTTLRLFTVAVANTGAEADTFTLGAVVSAPTTTVMISDGTVDATGEATHGTYVSAAVPAGSTHSFVIWLRPWRSAPWGDVRAVALTTSCSGSPAPADTVVAQIRVRR